MIQEVFLDVSLWTMIRCGWLMIQGVFLNESLWIVIRCGRLNIQDRKKRRLTKHDGKVCSEMSSALNNSLKACTDLFRYFELVEQDV